MRVEGYRCRFPKEHAPHTYVVETIGTPPEDFFADPDRREPELVAVYCWGGTLKGMPEAVQRALRGED